MQQDSLAADPRYEEEKANYTLKAWPDIMSGPDSISVNAHNSCKRPSTDPVDRVFHSLFLPP